MYSAMYLPSSDNYPDPSAHGFRTKEKAEKYVFKHMCKTCRDDRARYLKNKRKGIKRDDLITDEMTDEESMNIYDQYGDSWPACACEWLIIETYKLEDCENLGEMFDAAGFTRVEKENENV